MSLNIISIEFTATIPPITISEHPVIWRHPNGSSVRILELIAPTIISDKNRIEHIPAPIWVGAQRITIPVGIK